MLARFEGRLFVQDSRLCMVIEANEATGIGRVSCRIDGKQTIREMPLFDIAELLSGSDKLSLDGVGTPDNNGRVVRKTDGWFFSAREGLMGPYATDAEAQEQLGRYMVASQG